MTSQFNTPRRRIIRRVIIGIVTFAVIGVANVGWAQPPGMKMPALPVLLAKVQQKEIQKKLWYSGNLLSKHRANLAAESNGRVLNVAEVGEQFEIGDEIAQLDDTLLKQGLAEQEAEVKNHQARSVFLQREVDRLTILSRGNNAALSQLESTQADLSAAQSAREAALARVARIREELQRMRITAPFSGIVAERFAEAGEWLSPGDPVVRLVNARDLEITTSISEEVLSYIAIGDVLEVVAGQKSYRARVRTIVPVGDSRSRLFELRLTPLGEFGYAQQLVRVAVPVSSPHDGLVVPEDALVIRQDNVSVFVIPEDMRARNVPVEVGLAGHDGLIEVKGALRIGDKVVVRGSERLRDGMEVRLIAPDSPS